MDIAKICGVGSSLRRFAAILVVAILSLGSFVVGNGFYDNNSTKVNGAGSSPSTSATETVVETQGKTMVTKSRERKEGMNTMVMTNSTISRGGEERNETMDESAVDFDSLDSMQRVTPFSTGQWHYAHATFYGDESAQETMQGACGYQNLWQQGYGAVTTALSATLFNHGFACGSCFEIRCVGSWACYPGNPGTKVTATNFCPANWARPTNNGGWCNPPRQHFDMSKPAFEKIAHWRAGIVPVAYRRVPCAKKGNMEFLIEGNQWWHIVFITNVGGPGDIGQVYVRSSRSQKWLPMTHNWGAGFQIFGNFLGESLSFMVISSTNYETVVSWNMVPSNWKLGQTFIGGQFQHSYE